MTDAFSDSYTEARGRFVAAAAWNGGTVKSYVNPHALGPNGDSLSIETAVFGPPDAEKALLIVSGTHGQEGYTGSAGQQVFMNSRSFADRDPSVRIVLVHALNPYGFAYDTRVNENNVDLNRNFIDFSGDLPDNPLYAEIHPVICPDEWTDESRSEIAFRKWMDSGKFAEWMNAINAGQYAEPTGFGYGGLRLEWSGETLKAILAEELRGIRKLGFIDWHTGLGDYGEPFFLCFNEQPGPDWERACNWWGRDRIENRSGFGGAPRPEYSGLVFQGVQRFAAPAEMTGAVIEFGTGPILEVFDWHRRDRWLRFGTSPTDPELRARFRQGVRNALFPTDPEWRRSVIAHAETIQAQALAGVAAW